MSKTYTSWDEEGNEIIMTEAEYMAEQAQYAANAAAHLAEANAKTQAKADQEAAREAASQARVEAGNYLAKKIRADHKSYGYAQETADEMAIHSIKRDRDIERNVRNHLRKTRNPNSYYGRFI